MRPLVLSLVCSLAALGACTGKDTDTEVPVETGDTGDDIPDTFLGRTEKPSDVERTGEALRAGLLAVTVESDDSWTLGANLGGGKLSGTGNFGIQLPDVAPADDLRDLPGGRRGALYLPVVYDDTDKDDVYTDNDDDYVLGFAADRWLVYLESGAEGEDTGWSVVDPTGSDWTFYRLTEQAGVKLYGLSAKARLQGIYEGEAEGLGVVAIDERVPGEGVDDWSPIDVSVAADNGQFDDTAEARPPIGAFQFPDDADVRLVRATLRFYSDDDASGDYDPAQDSLLPQGLCYQGQPLVMRFSDTPRTIAIAREIARLQWTTGWRIVSGPHGASTEIPRADLQWHRFGDDCDL